METIPRPEYPRPQFMRDGWMNLNGEWQFEIDQGCSGRSRGLLERDLMDKILVPFCPESELSGIQHKDFMRAVWYKRTFILPKEAEGKHIQIHFGAVDYRCEVWVNGLSIGTHEGGYVSFSFNATAAVRQGENVITVCAEDDTLSRMQPTGKQSDRYGSYGCFYTRTTGIWQTVWLEWMNTEHIDKVFITPDVPNTSVHIRARIAGGLGCTLTASTAFGGAWTGGAEGETNCGWAEITVKLTEEHLWSVGDGQLYDLTLSLAKDGQTLDTLNCYFGLRSIAFDGMRFLLNGKPVFQRLVLDQGFYPDGIYTAPTDDSLRGDIELSMSMGFNGARLHQKVFEPRFLYWADVKGYLCWGEMANWGLDHSDIGALNAFAKEWIQEIERDYSAPSIIGWCPFNETWDYEGRRQNDDVLRMIYRITKALDHTRPCIDTSGNYHVQTDIYDVHDYEQDVGEFTRRFGRGAKLIHDNLTSRQHYSGNGMPVFVSEYGGIRWTPDMLDAENDQEKVWGYGNAPRSEQEFLDRYRGLTHVLLGNPDHFGFCYTQLTDVEQEQNGLYTYDRRPKFDPAIIRAINTKKAACEE